MTLRAMLFIGLGGTGGKVLGVIQNTLARRLQSAGVSKIPQAWQFLHLDLPNRRDADEGGHAFGLAGDDYAPLTRPGDVYSNQHHTLKQRLGDQELFDKTLGNWAPIPRSVPEGIDRGAGQLRAVGRVVALAHLPGIKSELSRRLNEARNSSTEELRKTASAMGIPVTEEPITEPLVVVIGSLSGGSGAGLVGDVLDLLRSEGEENPLVNLFTPEVFTAGGRAPDEGLAPNSLTTILELMAADWNVGGTVAGTHYTTSRETLYLSQQLQAPAQGGALGYYLVGARTEKGTVFTSPQDVYRVVGSMYAELALDQDLLTSVVTYLHTNFTSKKLATPDSLGLSANSGADKPNLMGMGFAKLSIGREYFTQYALHRLLRLACDRLLEAHLDVAESLRNLSRQELLERSISENYPPFVKQLRLDELDTPQGHMDDIRQRLTVLTTQEHGASRDHFMQTLAGHIQSLTKGTLIKRISSADAGTTAYTFVGLVSGEADEPGAILPSLRARAKAQFLQRIEGFEAEVQQELAVAIPEFAATLGLPVTVGILKRLVDELRKAASQLEAQSRTARTSAQQRRETVAHVDPQQARSFSPQDLDTIDQITGHAAEAVDAFINSDELELLARLVRDLAGNLISSWASELEEDQHALRERVDSKLSGGGTLRTIWPTETGAVPGYLKPSKVELTLDDIDQFPADFLQQVTARMPYSTDDDMVSREESQREAVQDAVRDIITGRRDEIGSAQRVQWSQRPVTTYGTRWVSRLRSSEKPQTAVVRASLTLGDLEARALEWLTDPEESTRAYLDCTLREYLNPPDVSDEAIRARHDRMVAQFGALLDAALPLISVNNNFHTWIHGSPRSEPELILGQLDVPDLAPEVQERLDTAPLSQRLRASFRNRVTEGGGTLNIGGPPSRSFTLLSVPRHPLNLLAVDSIMKPVSEQRSAVGISGWQHRRARPLSESVPLSPDTQVHILTGLFAGRLLGEVEFDPDSFRQLRVRCDGEFLPLELDGLREWHAQLANRDFPGRVLESVVTTMVEAYRRQSLDPLKPLQELYALGEACSRDWKNPLKAWMTSGAELPRTEDGFRLQPGGSPDDRRQQVTHAIRDFRSSLTVVAQNSGAPDVRNLATFEILDLIAIALNRLEPTALQRGGRI